MARLLGHQPARLVLDSAFQNLLKERSLAAGVSGRIQGQNGSRGGGEGGGHSTYIVILEGVEEVPS